MNESQSRLAKAYRRAAIGLALAAVVWTAAFLIGGGPGEEKTLWLIPIAAAAMSVACFSLSAKS